MKDPHLHVERNLNRDAAGRDLLASTFGLVADAPATVTTGCGRLVPYAMTSSRPESVTCLACRNHAVSWNLRMAEQMQGSALPGQDLQPAVEHYRKQAERFR